MSEQTVYNVFSLPAESCRLVLTTFDKTKAQALYERLLGPDGLDFAKLTETVMDVEVDEEVDVHEIGPY